MARIPGEPLLLPTAQDEIRGDDLKRSSADHETGVGDSPHRVADWQWYVGLLVAPILLAVVARPDLFHVQDGIDPYVNRGYVEDLPTLIGRVGDHHYFVTRWTIYLPGRAFFLAFGTVGGYVLHHVLLMAMALVPLAAWARHRWGNAASLCAYVTALCSPALVRAVFTEYSTAVAVPFLTAAAVLLLAPSTTSRRLLRAAAAGALVVGAAVANPFSAAPAAVLLTCWGVWQIVATRRLPWREVGLILASGAVVVLAGLFWFRWRYDIANVYQPTLDWIDLPPSGAEAIRATDAGWLNTRLWIYLPLFLGTSWGSLWLARRRRPPGYQICAVVAMIGTLLLQSWYQLSGEAIALELFFYWSYQLPTLLVVLTVVIGELIASSQRYALALVLPVVAVCFVPLRPTWAHLPVAIVSVPLLIALAAAAGACRRSGLAPALVIGVFLLPQLATPTDAQRVGLRIDPSYDSAFGGVPIGPSDDPPAEQVPGLPWIAAPPGRQGWGGMRAVGELTRVMASLDQHARDNVWLWAGGGWGWPMASAYGGSRSGRLVNEGGMGSAPGSLPDSVMASLESEQPGYLAMFGTPLEVREMREQISTSTSVTEVARASVDPDGQPTDVLVVRVGESVHD